MTLPGHNGIVVRLHRCRACNRVRDTSDAAPHTGFICEGWEDAPHDAARMEPQAYMLLGSTADTDQGRWTGHGQQTLREHVHALTCGDPPNRACLPGSDDKWNGYLLGIEEALRAVGSFAGSDE